MLSANVKMNDGKTNEKMGKCRDAMINDREAQDISREDGQAHKVMVIEEAMLADEESFRGIVRQRGRELNNEFKDYEKKEIVIDICIPMAKAPQPQY